MGTTGVVATFMNGLCNFHEWAVPTNMPKRSYREIPETVTKGYFGV